MTKKLPTYINNITKNYEKILKFGLTFIPFLNAIPKIFFHFYSILSVNMKKTDLLGDLGLDGIIILKCIFKIG